ncbi:MAG: ImmA/IrrE family metallo-endopeptidase [Phycisphaerales bacterium]
MHKEIQRHLEMMANYVRYRYGCLSTPTDLEKLAQGLGVKEIRQDDMSAWGCVENGEHGLVIRLRKDSPHTRMRFSLAHEIGHVMLELLEKKPNSQHYRHFRSYAQVASGADEESMADQLAAYLLLPTDYMMRAISGDWSLARLSTIARQAGVSLSASMIRSVDLFGYPIVAFHARRLQGEPWKLKWSRTNQPHAAEDIKSTLEDSSTLGAICSPNFKGDRGAFTWTSIQTEVRRYHTVQNLYGLARITAASAHSRTSNNATWN